MDSADEAIVYYNPHTIEHKKLKSISEEQVRSAFQRDDLKIFTDSSALKKYLLEKKYADTVLLLMSSGTFDGINLEELAKTISR
jgi:UDP-N-acetylmuramate: L-alanyl-gamma-D-glutamyl-meso-diaminopimelate ligase